MDNGSDNFLQAFLLLLLNDTAQTALEWKSKCFATNYIHFSAGIGPLRFFTGMLEEVEAQCLEEHVILKMQLGEKCLCRVFDCSRGSVGNVVFTCTYKVLSNLAGSAGHS